MLRATIRKSAGLPATIGLVALLGACASRESKPELTSAIAEATPAAVPAKSKTVHSLIRSLTRNPQLKPAPTGQDNTSRAEQVLLGKWLDTGYPGWATRSIYWEDGKLYMQVTARNGRDSSKEEAIRIPSRRGSGFATKKPSELREYAVIDKNGNLELWDQVGFIRIARKSE